MCGEEMSQMEHTTQCHKVNLFVTSVYYKRKYCSITNSPKKHSVP